VEDRFLLVKSLNEAQTGEGDLNLAFYSACSLLGVNNFFVDARFHEFAGLKAEVKIQGGKITARVSDGFKAAPQEAVQGLALHLLSKAFRKHARPEHACLLRAYKAFAASASASRLSDSLRRLRGRRVGSRDEGSYYDLRREMAAVVSDYAEIFSGVNLPKIAWSREKSFTRLGFHDSATNTVVVSKAFDSPNCPSFVLHYIIFHELLHAKHEVLFERGKSLRRTVHSRAFKEDERNFKQLRQAEEWIKSKMRWLR
jgi:hypothetical protein